MILKIKNGTKYLKKIKLFCDGSCNPQEKIGYGAYILIEDDNFDLVSLKSKIIFKRFENTSSTKLEIETLLWALNEINTADCIIEVYTDCQNIIGLENRREKLEKNNFQTSSGKLINNYELYKEFFEKLDELNLSFIKVKGHKRNGLKDELDTIFNIVDKASRKALRENMLT